MVTHASGMASVEHRVLQFHSGSTRISNKIAPCTVMHEYLRSNHSVYGKYHKQKITSNVIFVATYLKHIHLEESFQIKLLQRSL